MRIICRTSICTVSIFILLTLSCKKEEQKIPDVVTANVTNITQHSAISGGNITSSGSSEITERGLCWSTFHEPTRNDSRNVDPAKKTGGFVSVINALERNKTYYARAYATNSYGTAYGQEVSFTTANSPTDFDGNIYDTIRIGTQVWFKQNLKVTHYGNGDPIPKIAVDTVWQKLVTGAFHDGGDTTAAFSNTYGHLYNGFAVWDSRKLCPDGWHASTDADWTKLATYVGGSNFAGDKLREKGESHWVSSTLDVTNEYGFTALPAGGGSCISCSKTGYQAMFWSMKGENELLSTYRIINYNQNGVNTAWGDKQYGLSVRCVKD